VIAQRKTSLSNLASKPAELQAWPPFFVVVLAILQHKILP
jgi:hypothetical protein